jgi:hypothetical protein
MVFDLKPYNYDGNIGNEDVQDVAPDLGPGNVVIYAPGVAFT